MSVQTTTTVEQATLALEGARKVYARFGYGSDTEQHLLGILTRETVARRGRSTDAAEDFRNYLWSTFTGGGVSASVTREVFTALGRGEETDPNWI